MKIEETVNTKWVIRGLLSDYSNMFLEREEPIKSDFIFKIMEDNRTRKKGIDTFNMFKAIYEGFKCGYIAGINAEKKDQE